MYTYTFLLKFFPHIDYYRILNTVLCSRFLLIISFTYSNVYLLSANS